MSSEIQTIANVDTLTQEFNNIKYLKLNDISEEYIDIYVPANVVSNDKISDIVFDYDIESPDEKTLKFLDIDKYINNNKYDINIRFVDKVDASETTKNNNDKTEIIKLYGSIISFEKYVSVKRYNGIYEISISNQYFVENHVDLNEYILQNKQSEQHDLSYYFDTSNENTYEHKLVIIAEDKIDLYDFSKDTPCISIEVELEYDVANINHKNINVSLILRDKILGVEKLNYTYKYNYPFEDDVQIEIIYSKLYLYISETYITNIFNKTLKDICFYTEDNNDKTKNYVTYKSDSLGNEIQYDIKINLLKKRFEIIFNDYNYLTEYISKNNDEITANGINFDIDIYDNNTYDTDITNINYNISLTLDGNKKSFNNIIVHKDSYSSLIINILNKDFYNIYKYNLSDVLLLTNDSSIFSYHINNQYNFNGQIVDSLEIRFNGRLEELISTSNYNNDTNTITVENINLTVNNEYKYLNELIYSITLSLCLPNSNKKEAQYKFQYIKNKKDDIEVEIYNNNILFVINGYIFERAFNTKLENFENIVCESSNITLNTDAISINKIKDRIEILYNPADTVATASSSPVSTGISTQTSTDISTQTSTQASILNNVSIQCNVISTYNKIIYNDIEPSEYNYTINIYKDGKLDNIISENTNIKFSQDSNNSVILNIDATNLGLSNYIHYDPYPNINKIYDYYINSNYYDENQIKTSLEIRYDDISKMLVTGTNVINVYFTKLETNIDDYIFNVNVNLLYKYTNGNNYNKNHVFRFIKGQRDEVEFELNSTKTKLLLSVHETYFNKAFGFDLSDCRVTERSLEENTISNPGILTPSNSSGASNNVGSTVSPTLSVTETTTTISSTPTTTSVSTQTQVQPTVVNYGIQYNSFKNRIEILYNVADIRKIDNYDSKQDKTINVSVNCEVEADKVKKLHTPANEFKYQVNVYLHDIKNHDIVANHVFTFNSKELINDITVASDKDNKPILYIDEHLFNRISERNLSELVEYTENKIKEQPYNAFINNAYVDKNGELINAIEIRYNKDTTSLDLSEYNVCDFHLVESTQLTKLKYNITITEYKDENYSKIYKEYNFIHIRGYRDEVEFEINNKKQVILSILNHNFIKIFDSSIDKYEIRNNSTASSTVYSQIDSSSTSPIPFTYTPNVNIFKDRLEIVCSNINSIDEDLDGSVNISISIRRKDYKTYKYGETLFGHKYCVTIVDTTNKNTYKFNYVNSNNTGGILLSEDDNSKGTIVITNDVFKKKTNKDIDDFVIVYNNYTDNTTTAEANQSYNINYNLYANSKGEYENAIEIELNDNYIIKDNNEFVVNLANDSLDLDDYFYNIKVQEVDNIFNNELGEPYIFKYEKGIRDELEFTQTLTGDVILIISNNNFKKMFENDIDDYGVIQSKDTDHYEYEINKFEHRLEVLIKDAKNKGLDNDGNSKDKTINLTMYVYKKESIDKEKLPLETIDNYYTINIYFNNEFIDGFTTNCIGNNKANCFDLYYDENENIEFKFDLCKAFDINNIANYVDKELIIDKVKNISGSYLIDEQLHIDIYRNNIIGECTITGKFTNKKIVESINNIYLCLADKISNEPIETHYIDMYIDGYYYDRFTNLNGFDLDYDTNKFTITGLNNKYAYVKTNIHNYINIINVSIDECITGYFAAGQNYGKMYLKNKGKLTKYKLITIPNKLHKIPIIKFDLDKRNDEVIIEKPIYVSTVAPIKPTPSPTTTAEPLIISTTTTNVIGPMPAPPVITVTSTPEPSSTTPTITPTIDSSVTPTVTPMVTVTPTITPTIDSTVTPKPVTPSITPTVGEVSSTSSTIAPNYINTYGFKIHSLSAEAYDFNSESEALAAAKYYIDRYGIDSYTYPIYIYYPSIHTYKYVLNYTKAIASTTTTPIQFITPLLTVFLYYNGNNVDVHSLYSLNSNNEYISMIKYVNASYDYLCKVKTDIIDISNKKIKTVTLNGLYITNYKIINNIINIGLSNNFNGKSLKIYLEDNIIDVVSSTSTPLDFTSTTSTTLNFVSSTSTPSNVVSSTSIP